MHFLIGLGLIAALVMFAFGERAARAFVGVTLCVLSIALIGVLGIWAFWDGAAPIRQTHTHDTGIRHSMELPGLTEDQIKAAIRQGARAAQ